MHGIRAIGVHALEMARVEAGYLAAYEDFLPAKATVRTGRTRSPLELGLEWLVDFTKPNFNGRRALAEEKRRGPTWRLVKLDIEGNKVAHSSYIFENESANKKEIGFITSAEWSPICKQNVALVRFAGRMRNRQYRVGGNLLPSARCHWSRVMAKATVMDKPFWFPPRRGATPPARF